MQIPSVFQANEVALNQGSLQDFVECRRRFLLRHIRRLAWPAIENEPALENERYMQQGARFHHLLHQHLLGVPEPRLSASLAARPVDEDLRRWWENYLEWRANHHDFPDLWQPQARLYPERSLAATLDGGEQPVRLVAKYDLLAVIPPDKNGSATRLLILDWKTSRRSPSRAYLAERMQTRVYPYLLVQAGERLLGLPVAPDQVELVYWFAEDPANPVRFPYSQARFLEDERTLNELASLLLRLQDEADYPLTNDERCCAYCTYRSLCDRGVSAGEQDDEEIESSLDWLPDLNLEQIQEVEF
jgi:hypothetical protein